MITLMRVKPDPAQTMQIVVKYPLGRNLSESNSGIPITRMPLIGMRVLL